MADCTGTGGRWCCHVGFIGSDINWVPVDSMPASEAASHTPVWVSDAVLAELAMVVQAISFSACELSVVSLRDA